MAANPFSGPDDLLASAQGHLDELTGLLESLYREDWADIVQERDPDTGNTLCKVRFSEGVPIRVATRIFNVVTELRAALDHAVYSATVLLTGRADPSRAKFPFGDTAAAFEQDLNSGAEHAPSAIHSALIALKPYEAGNITLWRLNKLRNAKDHRKLVVPAPRAIPIHVAAGSTATRPEIKVATSASAENDYVVAIIPPGPPGSKTQLELGLIFHVVFGEIEQVKGLDPIMFLRSAHEAVQTAVDSIRVATFDDHVGEPTGAEA